MDLYIVNICLVIIWYVIISFKKIPINKRNRAFFIIVSIQFFLFHSFRDPFIYPDNDTYALAFDNIRQMSFHEALLEINRYTAWGPGYVLINWLLGLLTSDNSILFYLTSFIIIGCSFWFYYKTSNNLLVSSLAFLLYPFLFYQSMYAIRQHTAAAILLLSLLYINRLKISLPLFFVAVMFHTTAIVFVPFYFLFYYMKKMSIIHLVLVGCLILIIFKYGMIYFLQNMERFEHYQDVQKSNSLPLLVMGTILIAHLFNRSFNCLLSISDLVILKYLVYSTFILIGLLGTGGGRLASYFIYIMPSALPMILKYNKAFKWWKSPFILLYMILLSTLWFLQTTNDDFVNYSFSH